MKPSFALAFALLSTVAAHADLVIEQTIDAPNLKGVLRYRIKGDKARIDSPAPGGGSMSTYIEASTGNATALNHQSRTAFQTNMLEVARRSTEHKQAVGESIAPVVPVKTGNTDRIGQWNAEEYSVTARGTKYTLWMSTDVANWSTLKKQMAPFMKSAAPGLFDPSTFEAPGYIVKTETISGDRKVTTRLFSIEERPVRDEDMAVPGGYKMMQMPAK